jgi:hypothetical protein
MGAVPAAGDIDSNPNVLAFGPVMCEDGSVFDTIWSPNPNAAVGHDPDSNAVGIGKEFWITDAAGTKLALVSRPITPGHAEMTVFCWWPWATDTGFIGAEILFSGNVRP